MESHGLHIMQVFVERLLSGLVLPRGLTQLLIPKVVDQSVRTRVHRFRNENPDLCGEWPDREGTLGLSEAGAGVALDPHHLAEGCVNDSWL